MPKLGISDDGAVELRAINKRIEIHRNEPAQEIGLLLLRATYRGRAEDYVEAEKRSADWIATAPNDLAAWQTRTGALSAVHEFTAARAALARVQQLARDKSDWLDLETSIDEADGHRDRSFPRRLEAATKYPTTINRTMYAAALALDGRYDEAIREIEPAAKALRDNSPEQLSWLLFQWGRLYEQKGELAHAREFYQQAHDRFPGYGEVNAHLAQTMQLTNDREAATRVLTDALAWDRHPALLELAGQTDEARTAWEHYVTVLPRAFSDHAARFYLGSGHDPARALALAQQNLANRNVPEARALVVEAAMAAHDSTAACDAAEGLVTAPIRAHRFTAWQALSACGRTAAADQLAKDLGIK
ncbi:MAG: hypothetical protein QM831_28935 [Kofleriaceae bacterium]